MKVTMTDRLSACVRVNPGHTLSTSFLVCLVCVCVCVWLFFCFSTMSLTDLWIIFVVLLICCIDKKQSPVIIIAALLAATAHSSGNICSFASQLDSIRADTAMGNALSLRLRSRRKQHKNASLPRENVLNHQVRGWNRFTRFTPVTYYNLLCRVFVSDLFLKLDFRDLLAGGCSDMNTVLFSEHVLRGVRGFCPLLCFNFFVWDLIKTASLPINQSINQSFTLHSYHTHTQREQFAVWFPAQGGPGNRNIDTYD